MRINIISLGFIFIDFKICDAFVAYFVFDHFARAFFMISLAINQVNKNMALVSHCYF